ncbi:MAG TPA: hypothetical protein VJT72_01840 [Pseudonocardiaceae bacterium]|nr:hypothetical protein [Pseudonocardiaceae bacterium]
MITFTFDSDKVNFQGRYRIVSGVFTVEERVFFNAPNNSASGFAAVSLVPQGGPAGRTFIVAGIFTDNDWKAIIALPNIPRPKWPIQPPFSTVCIS